MSSRKWMMVLVLVRSTRKPHSPLAFFRICFADISSFMLGAFCLFEGVINAEFVGRNSATKKDVRNQGFIKAVGYSFMLPPSFRSGAFLDLGSDSFSAMGYFFVLRPLFRIYGIFLYLTLLIDALGFA
jgi:hypothetical protein